MTTLVSESFHFLLYTICPLLNYLANQGVRSCPRRVGWGPLCLLGSHRPCPARYYVRLW